jgi:hypothetical protein
MFRVSLQNMVDFKEHFFLITVHYIQHSPTHLFQCSIYQLLRYEVFTAVTVKNFLFWDVALCTSYVNRRFGGTYRLHLHVRKIRERGTRVSRWLQTESPVGNNQLYKNRERGGEGHIGNQQKGQGYGLW